MTLSATFPEIRPLFDDSQHHEKTKPETVNTTSKTLTMPAI